MNKKQNQSVRAAALQITLGVALLSIGSIILASGFGNALRTTRSTVDRGQGGSASPKTMVNPSPESFRDSK
jgi:hypothetical protein